MPNELNLYIYAANSPLFYFDPNGLKSIIDYYYDLRDVENINEKCKDLFQDGQLKCTCDDFGRCNECAVAICEHYGHCLRRLYYSSPKRECYLFGERII